MKIPTFVLVPGLGSDATVWRRTIAALGADFRCLVGDTLSDDTLPGMARRILADASPSFALAGVSMGGMVALEIAAAAPQRVTHLALLDTRARADTLGQTLYRRLSNLAVAMTRDFEGLARSSLGGVLHPSAPADVRDELAAMSARTGAKLYLRQNRAVRTRRDLRAVLPTLAAPLAVIVGAQDRITPVAASREIHALAPGSTLHVLPDCGHLPPIEQPEATAALLRALHARRRA